MCEGKGFTLARSRSRGGEVTELKVHAEMTEFSSNEMIEDPT